MSSEDDFQGVRRGRQVRSLSVSCLVTLGWTLTFLMLFSWAGRWVFAAELLSSVQLQMGLVGIGLAALLFACRIPRVATGLLLVSLATLANPLEVYWRRPAAAESSRDRLRVMAFNILVVNRQNSQIKLTIEKAQADVVLLVEYAPWHEELLDDLRDTFPYQLKEPRNYGYGLAILSRYPIVDHEIDHLILKPDDLPVALHHSWKEDPYILATVEWNGRKLQIMGVHLFNPTSFSQFLRRTQQFDRLTEIVKAQTEHPLILMGDFNCVPWSPFFRDFLRATGLSDSRNGFGYQGSWPTGGDLVSIPIDHILVSRDLSVQHRQVLPVAGSDHYPVICDLSILNDETVESRIP